MTSAMAAYVSPEILGCLRAHKNNELALKRQRPQKRRFNYVRIQNLCRKKTGICS